LAQVPRQSTGRRLAQHSRRKPSARLGPITASRTWGKSSRLI
jgi:hypothetical protein